MPTRIRPGFFGDAGEVVQARHISGGVHFHQAGSRGQVPRQLPAAVRDFTGRAADLLTLDALLPDGTRGKGQEAVQPGTVVISAIDGASGIGKTTLAVYWAHRVRDRFPDGTLYADLRGYGPGQRASPGEVLTGFLHALGASADRIPETTQEQAGMYRSLLDGRRVLVVLDNANAPDQVRPLLPASPGCLALITSRSSMSGLVISQGAARVSLDLLPLGDAAALVTAIIGGERAGAEPGALQEIVRACARLPLALRIAGHRAASRPHLRLADIAAELGEARGRLDALTTPGDELTTVRAVLGWSYEALPPEQARLFRLLGLHPGTEISVHAAAGLADTGPRHARALLDALAEVHMAEPAARDRYRLHDLLRAYALEQAEAEETPDDTRSALRRLMGFYLHTADAADRLLIVRTRPEPDAVPAPQHPLAFRTRQQALEWYVSEYANLIAVARHAASAGLHTLAWQLPAMLTGLFYYYGSLGDLLGTFESGLDAARALGDRKAEGHLLLVLAGTLSELRRFSETLATSRQALDTARELGNRAGESEALIYIGNTYRRMGEYEEAVRIGEQALSLRHGASAWSVANTLINLGDAYRDAGRPADSLRCLQEALPAYREASDIIRECITLLRLGNAHQALGRIGEATALHQQALAIARETGWLDGEGNALQALGSDLHAAGDTRAATTHWQQAAAIFDQTGNPQADDIRAHLETNQAGPRALPLAPRGGFLVPGSDQQRHRPDRRRRDWTAPHIKLTSSRCSALNRLIPQFSKMDASPVAPHRRGCHHRWVAPAAAVASSRRAPNRRVDRARA